LAPDLTGHRVFEASTIQLTPAEVESIRNQAASQALVSVLPSAHAV